MAAPCASADTDVAPCQDGERFVLALCQIEPYGNEPARSAAKLSALVGRARAEVGPDRNLVVIVPEVYLQHYGAFDPRGTSGAEAQTCRHNDAALRVVAAAAKAHRAAVVVTCALEQPVAADAGPPLPHVALDAGDAKGETTASDSARLLPFNAAIAIDADGSVAAVYGKTHLWNGDGFDHVERDLYQASAEPPRRVGWRKLAPQDAGSDAAPGTSPPSSGTPSLTADDVFPVFRLPAAGLADVNFGMCICYDVEHPAVVATYAARGVDVILVPTASTGPSAILSRVLVPARAYEAHATIAYCNYPSNRASAPAADSPEGAPAGGEESAGEAVAADHVPVQWAPTDGTGQAAAAASAFGSAAAPVWPLGFSGASVVYDGDGTLAGEPSPPGAESVTLVSVSGPGSARVAEHARRNPYISDRRLDLIRPAGLPGLR